jgi:F5/8 type C domain-containing protein
VLGHRFWYQAPYQLLLELPGFSNVRVPARFAAVATLTLSAAAALAFDRARPRSRAAYGALMAALVGGIVIDSASVMPAVPLTVETDLPDIREAASVVELPIGPVATDVRAMYRATGHGRPVVNGYSGYAPPHYTALVAGLMEGDSRTLEVIRRHGPVAVIVHDPDPSGGSWARMLAESGARRIGLHRGGWLFTVDRASSVQPSCARQPLTIASLRASMGSDPRLMLDGDRTTGWHSEQLQKGGEQLVIDLGAPHAVESVGLVHGPYARDFPRRLRIDGGLDESRMTEVWSGSVAAYAVEGALADGRMAPARIPVVTSAPVRFIALTQIGEAKDAMWSVAELEVCGK